MQKIKKDAFFVIDGSYLLYRSFFAMKPLYTSTGLGVQAVYGFCRTIRKLIDDFVPSHVIIVWDSKKKGFRHDMYEPYKKTRQKPPSDLFEQKEYILKFLDDIQMAHVTIDGCEADDIIAALAKKYKDRQVVIVTADKDLYQLLSENVLIFDPFKDRLIDKKAFKEERGFSSDKLQFYHALLGDTSDNIPGVAGVGKKTAQGLVTSFDSLEDLYEHLDKVKKDRIRRLLEEQEDNAFLSRELFNLRPPQITSDIRDMKFDKDNWQFAASIFEDLEFKSLLKALKKEFPHVARDRAKESAELQQLSLLDDTPSLKAKTWKLGVVTDEDSFQQLVDLLKKEKCFALDTETTGASPLVDELVGISFAVDKKSSYYLPFAHVNGELLDREWALGQLKPILEDKKNYVIMHHAKFDQLVLWNHGIDMPPIRFDTLIAANLLRKEWQKINLKQLSAFYLKEPMRKFKDVLGKKYKTFDQVPLDDAAEYAAYDSLQTFKLKEVLDKALGKERKLKKFFKDVEMPFYYVLLRMEQKGVSLDIDSLKKTGKSVGRKISNIENKIRSALDHKKAKDFNLNSPKQIEVLLFDKLKLSVVKKSSKGARSTDQEVLEELSKVHPIPGLILKYRELAKLKSTYVEPLPTFINPKTKRIHTTYSQTLVATGRLSSSNPNLQNIPAGEGLGMEVREAFVAPRGKMFLSADYSQVELRILAHLSQDSTLIKIFANGHDIHSETAAQLFEVPVKKVTQEQRQIGKRINFSIIYGVSAYGLSRDLGIKQSEAKKYIEKYFAQYPKVALWMEKTVERAIKQGYVETLYGRRRFLPEVKESNRTLFEYGKRIAVNSPVQGTQADIMKIAMINIDSMFLKKKLEARMILQIHDELVIELSKDELDIVGKIVKKEMESVVNWKIPLSVTIRTGKTWADVTK